MFLKIFGMGFIFNKKSYLRDGWNCLDFVIIITGYIPIIFAGNNNAANLSNLKSFRILRPLRTVSSIKSLKILLSTIISALPMLFNALMILLFFYLIFAIAGL